MFHNIGDEKSTSLWFDNWHAICPLSNFISKKRIDSSGLSLGSKVADVIKNGVWDWPMEITKTFDALTIISPPCLVKGKHDKVVWKSIKGVKFDFSLSRVWDDIRRFSPFIPWSSLVWFSQCIPRHSFMLWLAILDRGYFLGASDYLIWQERNLRTFQNRHRSKEELCDLIKDVVRLRIMGLNLKASKQIFEAANMWRFHVDMVPGSKCAQFSS
ncbi:hypothetical protein Tco_0919868 [Tanacetum coccineum]